MADATVEPFESATMLLGSLPLASMVTRGRLRLADGELAFMPTDDKSADKSFRAPITEFHSPARTALGLQVWHNSRRLRFAFGQSDSPVAANEPEPNLADQWVVHLDATLGPPPPDVHVRRAWPKWAWIAAIAVVTVAITVVAIALVVLTR